MLFHPSNPHDGISGPPVIYLVAKTIQKFSNKKILSRIRPPSEK
jgi:hypothetical protein